MRRGGSVGGDMPVIIGPPQRSQWRTIGDLLPHLWPPEAALRVRVVIALIALIAAKGATVAVPLFYKAAVDSLTGAGAAVPAVPGAGSPFAFAELLAALPLAVLLGYGSARILSLGFAELRDALFVPVQQRALRGVALSTFRHLHALSLRFHLDRQTGGLARAIERGVKSIENLLFYTLLSIAPTLIELTLACSILWSLFGAEYAAVVFVTVGLYGGFSFAATEWRIKFRRQMNDSDSAASSKAIDSLLNYETVKYFGNEEHEARRYDAGLAIYERAATASKMSLSALNLGQTIILSFGITLLMVMAAADVMAGRMSLGGFVAINAYMMQLAIPLNFLGMIYRELKQSLVDMESMFRLLLVPAEVTDRPGAPALVVERGTVEFDRVSFGYDPRRPILQEVSFVIPPGRTLAVVGASGAGKSTLSRLLFRFYDVNGGAVRIDGQDLRDVTQSSLRAAIGVVPQDTVLFNDTIFYNIAYGRPDASRDEVIAAARLARIHDFVEGLPDRYETRVGERGLKLSGGEKQRVAIARTILKGPRIMIFDEATSALDSRTEQEIQKSLREVSADRTTLVIAHRLSTIVDADEILVLQDGQVLERGRHAALLAAGGAYAAMWQRQQQQAAVEAELDTAAE